MDRIPAGIFFECVIAVAPRYRRGMYNASCIYISKCRSDELELSVTDAFLYTYMWRPGGRERAFYGVYTYREKFGLRIFESFRFIG